MRDDAPDLLPRARAKPGRRWLALWWRGLSPSRQDRFITLAPLLSVLLFLAAMIAAFWYLRNEEALREVEAVRRNTEVAQQQIRLRLIENQEQLLRMSSELVAMRTIDTDAFLTQAETFVRERPEVVSLGWRVVSGDLRARFISPTVMYASPPAVMFGASPASAAADRRAATARDAQASSEADQAFATARTVRQPVYSSAFVHSSGQSVFQVHIPMIEHGNFTGTLVAEYSAEALLRYFVPAEISRRNAMSLVGEDGTVHASTVARAQPPKRTPYTYSLPVLPLWHQLNLRGEGYPTSAGLVGNALFWMVVILSGLTVWMLLATWRHMRRKMQIQSALVSETNFRRAMENSMLTGMRAMDMEGRITYVNPAFCAMTGFAESELIGRLPPYPHWPRDRMEENSRILQQELQGRSPAGGIEVKVQRKDGSVFDARMYVSPLVDARGQQTGWMTSMTNITEAKRIRDQLSASHERFTTVLEGLDAAVSVVTVQSGELLFANRSYRLWFGADPRGHALLAGQHPGDGDHSGEADSVDSLIGIPAQHITETGADPREVYIESLQKWFDVRSRYLQWTDGRLAQMLIATDISARRRAEEQASHQAEKAQVSSRLITMGEMASSVAHELNQPLTAINNYCNGMISRVKAGGLSQDELVEALQKTSRQAQRAGQIIHRIRSFVKRSEPQRQHTSAAEIVEDALELAGIELRRRNVVIHTYVAQRLPALHVDPILIEQVLLNLLKNAAEAIDTAHLPASRRHIELRVVPRHVPDLGGMIEFSVTDTGPGLKEAVIARLYEAFFSTKADGLGIGLSLCRSIIESHQGRIRAENLYNAGAVAGCRFTFALPVDLSSEFSPSKQAELS